MIRLLWIYNAGNTGNAGKNRNAINTGNAISGGKKGNAGNTGIAGISANSANLRLHCSPLTYAAAIRPRPLTTDYRCHQ